jgi:predicted permease
MKDDPASPAGGGSRFPVRILLAVQIAVALVLVGGAGLFARTLANLRAIPLGFNPEKLVLFGISPGANGYDEVRGNQLYAEIRARLKRIPGVTSVSFSSESPVSGWMSNNFIRIEGETKSRLVDLLHVGPEYFDTLQVPMIAGRSITERDIASGTKVAVINQAGARKFVPDSSPVGRRFHWPSKPEWVVEIIGVAKDSAYDRIQKDIPPVMYIPYTQASYGYLGAMNYEVRTASDVGFTAAAIRTAIHEMDRMLPVEELKTMVTQIDEALGRQRLFASLVSLFGGITLVLACVGLYGSVAYSVSRRTREIGIRMALGAGRAAVLRMVLGQVAITTAVGLAFGIPAMRALAKLVESKLYGVKANDVPSITAATLTVLLVAGLAALVPARRATKIDPVRALRCD